jgi:transposase
MRDHDVSSDLVAKQFTRADRQRLACALARARQARLYRRLEALLLVAEGHSISAAARRVRVSRLSVQRWAARYLRERDPSALADRPRRGRPRVAAALTAGCLAALLARDPRALGYCATTWTVPLLVHDLRAQEGLAISARTLRRRLHESRYRWKRPRYIYRGQAAHVGQKKGG